MADPIERPLHASQHCRHYSYAHDKLHGGPTCALGIDLSAPGSALRCMPAPKVPCDKREEYTDAERRAWAAWRDERTARMLRILIMIPGSAAKRDETWGKSGNFKCPACDGGTVSWARASNNGHVSAACNTPNCFGIIQ